MPTLARLVTASGVLMFVAVAPAVAEPFALGPSDNQRDAPDLAVDGAGTAHVVYLETRDVIRYCRVPRGPRGCASEQRFHVPDGFKRHLGPQVAIAGPGRVVVSFNGFSNDPRNGEVVTFAA